MECITGLQIYDSIEVRMN